MKSCRARLAWHLKKSHSQIGVAKWIHDRARNSTEKIICLLSKCKAPNQLFWLASCKTKCAADIAHVLKECHSPTKDITFRYINLFSRRIPKKSDFSVRSSILVTHTHSHTHTPTLPPKAITHAYATVVTRIHSSGSKIRDSRNSQKNRSWFQSEIKGGTENSNENTKRQFDCYFHRYSQVQRCVWIECFFSDSNSGCATSKSITLEKVPSRLKFVNYVGNVANGCPVRSKSFDGQMVLSECQSTSDQLLPIV